MGQLWGVAGYVLSAATVARLGHGQRCSRHTFAVVEVPLIGSAELEHQGLCQKDLQVGQQRHANTGQLLVTTEGSVRWFRDVGWA